jgi:predicted RNA-binding Zn-ribbon protein involved in translation (DUF1610 family)
VNWHPVETERDQCPDCGLSLEIAAVRLSFFQKAAALFVCPNCARVQADCPTRVRVSDWLGGQDRKKSIAASVDLAPRDRKSAHPAGSRIVAGTPNKKPSIKSPEQSSAHPHAFSPACGQSTADRRQTIDFVGSMVNS